MDVARRRNESERRDVGVDAGVVRRGLPAGALAGVAALGGLTILATSLLSGCRAGYDAAQLQGSVDVIAGVDSGADGTGGSDVGPGDGVTVDTGTVDTGGRPDGVTTDEGPPPPPACGDGSINQASEACDDGNTDLGDGCDAACGVETGWSCLGAPSTCTPICGDGLIIRVPGDPEAAPGEVGLPCDDGNALGGDGCDETCHTEAGWTCDDGVDPIPLGAIPPGQGGGSGGAPVEGPWQGPSICHGTCGDRFVTADEECDNGALAVPVDGGGGTGSEPAPSGADGCDDTCHVMEGWSCATDPEGLSVCSTKCGDGLLMEPQEACDDGNGDPGDGCDVNCNVETHWDCLPLSPSPCWAICGDGYAVPGVEACDDGNGEPGDGCSADCQPEPGWTCEAVDELGTDVVCTPTCGDGLVVGAEQCDDGLDGPDNAWSGASDGCDVCAPSEGWTCDPASTSADGSWEHQCKPLCGDGIVLKAGLPPGVTPEQCDDGNDQPGDGCSPTCQMEAGWKCGNLSGESSICQPECGDGLWVGAEGCDDGNASPGDGCDASCQVEDGWQCGGVPGGKSTCAIWCLDHDGDGYGVGPHCPKQGVDCDDDSAAANPGFSEELCDGVDNDCDGLTDAQVCGDSDVGVCQRGVSYCQPDGTFGSCVGQIPASPVELCNGLDDTCDGHTDLLLQQDGTYAPPTQTCGFGVCAVTTEICTNGELVACVPDWGKAKAHEDCGNGKDDDCDGLVDEGCAANNDEDGCVWVAGADFPRDDTSDQGAWRNPLSSVQTAVWWAVDGGKDVCILGAPGCGSDASVPPLLLDGDIEMVDGVSVLGGFQAQPGGPAPTEGCSAVLVVSGPTGVHFDNIQSPTMLQGLRVRSIYAPEPTDLGGGDGTWAAAVTIDDSPGAVVADCRIFGSSSAVTSAGVLVRGAANADAAPVLRGNRILGGGTTDSAGVRSEGARPRIEGSCDVDLMQGGRCQGTCDPSKPDTYSDLLIIGGVHALDGTSAVAQTAVGVWLVDSPGARVASSAVCGFGSEQAEGVRIEGDAKRTVISTSSVGAAGGSTHDAAVHAMACEDTRPRIVGNSVLGAEAPDTPDADGLYAHSLGVWLQQGCHGVVEGNTLIAGLMAGHADFTAGVYCDPSGGGGEPPHCLVSRNDGIVGHAVQALLDAGTGTPLVQLAYGVKCEAQACGAIAQNGIIAGGAAQKARGVFLGQSQGTLVDGNLIWPGCATGKALGIDASSARARIQNNVVVATGGDCLGTDMAGQPTNWIALYTTTDPNVASDAELDVHSNLLFAAGHLAQAQTCQAAAVSMGNVAGPGGVYRNNILGAAVCQIRATVFASQEAGGPRYLGFNDLTPDASASYWNFVTNEAYATAADLDDSNADGQPVRFEHNLTVPVVLSDTSVGGIPTPPALDPGSPLVDHGTAAGAPEWDVDGEPRPAGDGFDIGADEVQ